MAPGLYGSAHLGVSPYKGARMMRSEAHPMARLIPLPIAFVVGSLCSDLASVSLDSHDWYFTGYVLTIAAWVTGLVAALPNVVDYFLMTRSRSQSRRRALTHVLCDIGV